MPTFNWNRNALDVLYDMASYGFFQFQVKNTDFDQKIRHVCERADGSTESKEIFNVDSLF